MEALILSRWQFGITTVYHFLFVPLTLGLSLLVAILETIYVCTGNEMYKNQTKFWGKLFLINFAMGVVTGIVQEFHFGMNWSEYSRFMGDIFGAPLAMEALTAFYLESTFLGLWIFGWDRIPKGLHAATMWIAALATNLSAFWILTANSFMQSPVGYMINNGRAEMTDFVALITNPYVLYQFPHTVLSGLVTAGFFLLAISAYHLLRRTHVDFFRTSFKLGIVWTAVSMLLLLGSGHAQTQFIAKAQPMKLAAAEALWETASPAPFAVAAVIDEENRTNPVELKIPAVLSMLVDNNPATAVKGINDIEKEYVAKYGPGNYIPAVTPVFWSFRIMVAAGSVMLLVVMAAGFLWWRGQLEARPCVLKAVLWSLPLPYIANSTGWFVAEGGRQPWIVFGLQRVDQAVSPNVSAASVWISLIGFTLVYALLAAAAVYLVQKFVRQGPAASQDQPSKPAVKGAALWN
ncbi:cytochrome ubiquinol oxidase subunit I [Sporomusa acidovorans]|uniref:Cytochrome bd ubiquinol oxidase subunit 1 n=1 Tax=Sporomusa acidovorans (strain ATCC 49682 / DSM 3132 / Mol) TaxID=1123286 RepID=A0ABZ3IWE9_SPOA4|nr:cytochrome ubiquinol oxidase subunit I [Sporomusa acidovorans]OZC17996.1 cytochrome bd ubiquinol oxidase subunit 1 [Sporomusa acidovorans DSM 3132]SDF42407.1 cytochrome bd-I ubiquinol oxidase subunit 1 apoprotein [Sporomusa acidovorans]